jgi:hypothetical protein
MKRVRKESAPPASLSIGARLPMRCAVVPASRPSELPRFSGHPSAWSATRTSPTSRSRRRASRGRVCASVLSPEGLLTPDEASAPERESGSAAPKSPFAQADVWPLQEAGIWTTDATSRLCTLSNRPAILPGGTRCDITLPRHSTSTRPSTRTPRDLLCRPPPPQAALEARLQDALQDQADLGKIYKTWRPNLTTPAGSTSGS